MLSFMLLQTDTNSAAYQAGQWFGRAIIFAAIFAIVIWVVRKFFGRKK